MEKGRGEGGDGGGGKIMRERKKKKCILLPLFPADISTHPLLHLSTPDIKARQLTVLTDLPGDGHG